MTDVLLLNADKVVNAGMRAMFSDPDINDFQSTPLGDG